MTIVVHREGQCHLDITTARALGRVQGSVGEEIATTHPPTLRLPEALLGTAEALEGMTPRVEATRINVAVETASVEIEIVDKSRVRLVDWMDGFLGKKHWVG